MLSPPGELLLEERFQALERNFKAVVGALRLRGPSPALDALVSKLDADQKHWVMRKQGSSSPLAKLLEERETILQGAFQNAVALMDPAGGAGGSPSVSTPRPVGGTHRGAAGETTPSSIASPHPWQSQPSYPPGPAGSTPRRYDSSPSLWAPAAAAIATTTPTAAVPAAARVGGYDGDGGADGELAARLESALAELQAARDGEAAAARREAELRESHRAELDAALEAARQEAKADLVAAATEHDRALHNQQFLAAKAAQEKREMESELEHWESMHEEWEAEKKATAAAHAERLAAAEAALSKARDEATAERVRYQNAEGRAEGSAAAAARASELKDELEAAQASERYSALQAEMQAMKAAEAHAEADALRAKVRKLEKAAAKAAAAAEPVAAAAAAEAAEASVAAEEELRGDTSSSSSSSSSGSGSDANGGGADAIAAVEKVVSLGAELKRTLTTAGGASPPPTRPAAAANASPDRGSRAVLGRTVRELNRQQLQVAALREKLSVAEASAGAARPRPRRPRARRSGDAVEDGPVGGGAQ